MKIEQTLFLSFVFASALAADVESVRGKVLAYGIFRTPAGEEIIETPGTSSGKTRITQGPLRLQSVTNYIPAELGIRFGFFYSITNLRVKNGEAKITKLVKHPQMIKPDGTTSEGFVFEEPIRVENGGAAAASGYGFDHEYELVPGIWDFEMRFSQTTICTQRFVIFKREKTKGTRP